MTRAERRWHRRHVLEGAAAELDSQIDNGAAWLFPDEDPGVPELSEEVRDYRVSILRDLVALIERKVGR